jgi:hypothetical protein
VQARTKTGEEADRLWVLAGEKYEEALKIKPDFYEALYNCSIALEALAKQRVKRRGCGFFNLQMRNVLQREPWLRIFTRPMMKRLKLTRRCLMPRTDVPTLCNG